MSDDFPFAGFRHDGCDFAMFVEIPDLFWIVEERFVVTVGIVVVDEAADRLFVAAFVIPNLNRRRLERRGRFIFEVGVGLEDHIVEIHRV